MNGNRAFRTFAICLALGIQVAAASRADSPWYNLLNSKQVEADPAKDYALKEENGPWIIMACSFNGPNAEKEAHALVLELRKRYQMEAFSYAMDFKFDDPNGDVQPLFASPHKHTYEKYTDDPEARRDGGIKEIAVVVGNFPAIGDPNAQRALQTLKAAAPDCLRDGKDDRSLAGWRALQAGVKDYLPKIIESRKQTGPLAHALITRNPLLPEDYFAAKGGLDELIVKMNQNVKYSLLDCPGKYTVQVAHFTGEVIIDQNKIREIENGSKPGPESTTQGLAAAAEKAHELTEALRLKGWKAYEFHDRNASLVTVESFDSCGTPRADGKIEINPEMYKVIQTFRADNVPGNAAAMQPKSLVGIYFDLQPIPVEVPKRSISRQLNQHLDMAGN